MPPHVCEHGVTAVSRAPETSGFLLLTICGIHAPERPVPFPHCLLHAASRMVENLSCLYPIEVAQSKCILDRMITSRPVP